MPFGAADPFVEMPMLSLEPRVGSAELKVLLFILPLIILSLRGQEEVLPAELLGRYYQISTEDGLEGHSLINRSMNSRPNFPANLFGC